MLARALARGAFMSTAWLLVWGLGTDAFAQPLGTFAWQIAPYCNVVRLSLAVDGNAFRLTGFDDQCGGAQLPVAGSAVARADGLYAVSFYVVTPNGLVSHLSAAVNPVSFSGPWSDSSGGTGTFVFSPPLPTTGNHRPPPRLPGTTIATASITASQLADATITTGQMADGSITGAKLRLPLSAAITSSSNVFQIGNTGTGVAIRGHADGPGSTGVSGSGASIGVSGSGVVGVQGRSINAYGVQGVATGSGGGIGLHGVSNGTGPALRLLAAGAGAGAIIENAGAANPVDVVIINAVGTGDIIQATHNGAVRFRVTPAGAVQGDGPYTSPAADVAEFIDTDETLTPGDVVEIDPAASGRFRRTTGASTRTVAGVVTTRPGVLLRSDDTRDDVADGPAIALSGRVPVKVCAENGPVVPGDLLVASGVPGHAMKAPEQPLPGTVIGKALGPYTAAGTGVIDMLVMLR